MQGRVFGASWRGSMGRGERDHEGRWIVQRLRRDSRGESGRAPPVTDRARILLILRTGAGKIRDDHDLQTTGSALMTRSTPLLRLMACVGLAAGTGPSALADAPRVEKATLFRAGEGGLRAVPHPGARGLGPGHGDRLLRGPPERQGRLGRDRRPDASAAPTAGPPGSPPSTSPTAALACPRTRSRWPRSSPERRTRPSTIRSRSPTATARSTSSTASNTPDASPCTARTRGPPGPIPTTSRPAFERFRPDYDWKVIATGPGHGIQLRTGPPAGPDLDVDRRRGATPIVRRSPRPSPATTTAGPGEPARSRRRTRPSSSSPTRRPPSSWPTAGSC